MNFANYLETTAKEIDLEFDKYAKIWVDEANTLSPKLVHMIELFCANCQGGKRIRGTLVRLGYELSGGEQNSDLIKPELAFEVLHTALLIHDDIIDRSITR